jgi:hypothetical protein
MRTQRNDKRIISATDERSGDLPGRVENVRADLSGQVTPYDISIFKHPHWTEDSVLETSEGFIDIGLTVSNFGKEQRIQRLSGLRKRCMSRKAETTLLVDNKFEEPQCKICNCWDGGVNCSRQCSQMFILERTDVFPLEDTLIRRQNMPLGTKNMPASRIGLAELRKSIGLNSDMLFIDAETLTSGVNGLIKKLPRDMSTVSPSPGAPGEGLKKLSKEARKHELEVGVNKISSEKLSLVQRPNALPEAQTSPDIGFGSHPSGVTEPHVEKYLCNFKHPVDVNDLQLPLPINDMYKEFRLPIFEPGELRKLINYQKTQNRYRHCEHGSQIIPPYQTSKNCWD